MQDGTEKERGRGEDGSAKLIKLKLTRLLPWTDLVAVLDGGTRGVVS